MRRTALGLIRLLIENNKDRLGKKLWTRALNGEKLKLYFFEDGKDEAKNVSLEIEKLKLNNNIQKAISAGYSKALLTIADANITTLIASLVLFSFGTGPVKGFAVTLGIGILTTLFSAYFISRHLISMVVFKNKEKKIII